jgi:hypothetical protein
VKPSTVPLFAGTFFIGWLAVQLALPLGCMVAGVACDHAWTMFAGRDVRWDFYVRSANGAEVAVTRAPEKLGRLSLLGKKVDEPRFVPQRLCREYSDAVAVRIVNQRTGLEEVRACRP